MGDQPRLFDPRALAEEDDGTGPAPTAEASGPTESPSREEAEWYLDERTRAVGKAGVARVREVMRRSRTAA